MAHRTRSGRVFNKQVPVATQSSPWAEASEALQLNGTRSPSQIFVAVNNRLTMKKKHIRDTTATADQQATTNSPRHKKARLADSNPAAAGTDALIPVMCGAARGQYSTSKGLILVHSPQEQRDSWVSRADFVNNPLLGGRGSHDYFKAIKVVAADGSSAGRLGKFLKQQQQGVEKDKGTSTKPKSKKKQKQEEEEGKKEAAAAAVEEEQQDAYEFPEDTVQGGEETTEGGAGEAGTAAAAQPGRQASGKGQAGGSGSKCTKRKSAATAAAAAAGDAAAAAGAAGTAPASDKQPAVKGRGLRKSAAGSAADVKVDGSAEGDTAAAATGGTGARGSPKRARRSAAAEAPLAAEDDTAAAAAAAAAGGAGAAGTPVKPSRARKRHSRTPAAAIDGRDTVMADANEGDTQAPAAAVDSAAAAAAGREEGCGQLDSSALHDVLSAAAAAAHDATAADAVTIQLDPLRGDTGGEQGPADVAGGADVSAQQQEGADRDQQQEGGGLMAQPVDGAEAAGSDGLSCRDLAQVGRSLAAAAAAPPAATDAAVSPVAGVPQQQAVEEHAAAAVEADQAGEQQGGEQAGDVEGAVSAQPGVQGQPSQQGQAPAAAPAAAPAPAAAVAGAFLPPPAASGPSFAALRAVLPHSEGLDFLWAIAQQVHGPALANPAAVKLAPIVRTYLDPATLDDCRQSFRTASAPARQATLERLAALQQLLGEPALSQPGPTQLPHRQQALCGIQALLEDCQAMWDGDSE